METIATSREIDARKNIVNIKSRILVSYPDKHDQMRIGFNSSIYGAEMVATDNCAK